MLDLKVNLEKCGWGRGGGGGEGGEVKDVD